MIHVAAHDAPEDQKAEAKYQCTGEDDQKVIQQAIDELGSPIILSAGTFNGRKSVELDEPTLYKDPRS